MVTDIHLYVWNPFIQLIWTFELCKSLKTVQQTIFGTNELRMPMRSLGFNTIYTNVDDNEGFWNIQSQTNRVKCTWISKDVLFKVVESTKRTEHIRISKISVFEFYAKPIFSHFAFSCDDTHFRLFFSINIWSICAFGLQYQIFVRESLYMESLYEVFTKSL